MRTNIVIDDKLMKEAMRISRPEHEEGCSQSCTYGICAKPNPQRLEGIGRKD